jgi:hypothetical protein
LELEGKTLEEVNEILTKLKEEKKERKDKKRKEKAEKMVLKKKLDETRAKKKEDRE